MGIGLKFGNMFSSIGGKLLRLGTSIGSKAKGIYEAIASVGEPVIRGSSSAIQYPTGGPSIVDRIGKGLMDFIRGSEKPLWNIGEVGGERVIKFAS